MPDRIRVFCAFPIARNDTGTPGHSATTRHETADAACLAAEAMAGMTPTAPPWRSAVSSTSSVENAHAPRSSRPSEMLQLASNGR